MTKQEASERNWKIHQLRGSATRIVNLIPKDALPYFTDEELRQAKEFGEKVIRVLDIVKKTKQCHICWTENKRQAKVCKECGEAL